MDAVTKRKAITAEASFNQIQYFEQIECLKVSPIITVELFTGVIDIASAGRAINALVRRHDSLRTCFIREDGVVKQVIHPFIDEVTILDLRSSDINHPSDDYIKDGIEHKKQDVHQVENLPLAVFVLTGSLETASCLYLYINHIIGDAWSADILKREFNYLYISCIENADSVLPPLQYQLSDYCLRQNSWINLNLSAMRSFWRNRLSHLERRFDPSIFYRGYMLRKPRDHELPTRNLSSFDDFIKENSENRASRYTTKLDQRSFIKLNEIAKRNSNMLSVVMYASLAVLLQIYLCDSRVLMASPVADRDLPYKRDLVGNLMGGVYLSLMMNENMSCGDVIALVSARLIDAVENIIFDHRILNIDESKVRPRCDLYVNFLHINRDLNEDITSSEKRHVKEECLGLYYPLNCIVEEYSNSIVLHWKYGEFMLSRKLIEDLSLCHSELIDIMWRDDNMKIESIKHLLLNKSLKKTLFERQS